MHGVWGKVSTVRPSNCAELVDKDLLKDGRVLQRLEYGAKQAILHFNDSLRAVVESHRESKALKRLY
jgi:hypothetical protein